MNYYIPWKSDSCIPWCTPWIENYTPLSSIVSRDMMMNSLWSSRYPWIEVIFPLSSIVSRDVMMNYYIPWKSLTGAYHDVRRGLKLYFPLSTDCLQRCTYSGNHGMPWCTPWIEIIFSIVSKVNTMVHICLPIVSRDVMILLLSSRYPWIENYIFFHCLPIVSRDVMILLLSSRYPWIENYIFFHCLPIVSRDVMMNYYIPWKSDSCMPWCTPWIENYIPLSPKWIQWYSIVCRLSPEMWWWITTFLEKSDSCIPWCTPWIENYFSIVCRLSPEMWWFHFGHCDIRGLKIIFPLSTDCLQRCDDELLHSLKKSDSCRPWCTPWIENYISHCLQSEYNGTHLSTIVSRDVMISLWSSRYSWFENYFFHCLPIVSRDVHILEIMAYHDVRCGLKIIFHDIQSEYNDIPLSTVVSRDVMMNYYIPWKSLTVADHDVRRGLKLYFPLSTDCLQRCTYSGNHGLPWCTPWIEIICHDIQSEYNWYTSVFHCLQRCDNELLHSLKKSDSCRPWCTPWIEIIFSIVYLCLQRYDDFTLVIILENHDVHEYTSR